MRLRINQHNFKSHPPLTLHLVQVRELVSGTGGAAASSAYQVEQDED